MNTSTRPYPRTVVVVEISTPGDDGTQYTLVFPDGKRVRLGDAEDNYGDLAEIIDHEYAKVDA